MAIEIPGEVGERDLPITEFTPEGTEGEEDEQQ